MLRPCSVVKLSIASFSPLEVKDISSPMDSGVTWYVKESIEGGDDDDDDEWAEPFPLFARHERWSVVRLLIAAGGRAS